MSYVMLAPCILRRWKDRINYDIKRFKAKHIIVISLFFTFYKQKLIYLDTSFAYKI